MLNATFVSNLHYKLYYNIAIRSDGIGAHYDKICAIHCFNLQKLLIVKSISCDCHCRLIISPIQLFNFYPLRLVNYISFYRLQSIPPDSKNPFVQFCKSVTNMLAHLLLFAWAVRINSK